MVIYVLSSLSKGFYYMFVVEYINFCCQKKLIGEYNDTLTNRWKHMHCLRRLIQTDFRVEFYNFISVHFSECMRIKIHSNSIWDKWDCYCNANNRIFTFLVNVEYFYYSWFTKKKLQWMTLSEQHRNKWAAVWLKYAVSQIVIPNIYSSFSSDQMIRFVPLSI